MVPDYDGLVARLRRRHPSVKFDPDVFPSGSAMVDAYVSGRHFILECHPGDWIGVDEVAPDEPLFAWSYPNSFKDITDAERKFSELLAAAEVFPVSTAG